MTPQEPHPHVRWFGRSDDDPNRLLIIEDEHSRVFLDANLREELYSVIGGASHTPAQQRIDVLTEVREELLSSEEIRGDCMRDAIRVVDALLREGERG